MDTRSRTPTAAPRSARHTPRDGTYTRLTGSRSRVTTAAPRGARPLPPPNTSICPTVCRPRETPSTFRDFQLSPLPDKGILDASGDLAVAGAATYLHIRAPWHDVLQAFQTADPFLPPRRASFGSPREAVRDLWDRPQNTQI